MSGPLVEQNGNWLQLQAAVVLSVILVSIISAQPTSAETDTRLDHPTIALDGLGRAHAFWTESPGFVSYARIGSDGDVVAKSSRFVGTDSLSVSSTVGTNNSVYALHESGEVPGLMSLLILDDIDQGLSEFPIGEGSGPSWVSQGTDGHLYLHWWNSTSELDAHRFSEANDEGDIIRGPLPLQDVSLLPFLPVVADGNGRRTFLDGYGGIDSYNNTYFLDNGDIVKLDTNGTELWRRSGVCAATSDALDVSPNGFLGVVGSRDLNGIEWVALDYSGFILQNKTLVSSDELHQEGEFHDIYFRFDGQDAAHIVWTYKVYGESEPHTGFLEVDYFIYHSKVTMEGEVLWIEVLERTWNIDNVTDVNIVMVYGLAGACVLGGAALLVVWRLRKKVDSREP